jgi:hypothetical protein
LKLIGIFVPHPWLVAFRQSGYVKGSVNGNVIFD